MAMRIQGHSLVHGTASGNLLVSDTSLSFWGGISPDTGIIIEQHHPLRGECVTGRIFAIPSGRGSCTGSGVLLELLLKKRGPAALIFQHVDEILTMGVMVAKQMFELSIPVLVVSMRDFGSLRSGTPACVDGPELAFGEPSRMSYTHSPSKILRPVHIKLAPRDERLLAGDSGLAAKLAMEILVDVAEMQGAKAFLDVSQAHIDACIYIGPASLLFAERFLSLGAKFAVPTTLNSISIDQRRWREIGMDPILAREAGKLAQAYMSMGAVMSFTCAPYLLETAPKAGENIGWAESNAVVFANSVLGARTQKYPDFLDVCIALTGRAPAFGCHLDEARLPKLQIKVAALSGADDSFWPLLGYHVGKLAGPDIPLICGLGDSSPSVSDLKAFGAAFATTASAPMFHIAGVTPESARVYISNAELPCYEIGKDELKHCWTQLNTAIDSSLGLVSLGNPHFSLEEFAKLAMLCSGQKKHSGVEVAITTSRAISEKAAEAGYLNVLKSFGARVITDTCWCMLGEPVVPVHAINIMTNSAKYAHYAPGMVQRGVHFGSLSSCVNAACRGYCTPTIPDWLAG
jgi:predicted aconitase/predicted aconitase with swiveling domain